jgi:hypothetical protein
MKTALVCFILSLSTQSARAVDEVQFRTENMTCEYTSIFQHQDHLGQKSKPYISSGRSEIQRKVHREGEYEVSTSEGRSFDSDGTLRSTTKGSRKVKRIDLKRDDLYREFVVVDTTITATAEGIESKPSTRHTERLIEYKIISPGVTEVVRQFTNGTEDHDIGKEISIEREDGSKETVSVSTAASLYAWESGFAEDLMDYSHCLTKREAQPTP